MKKGFTLIELLVVITILAILAGAALPYVQNYVEESRIAKAKTDLEEVARALAVYETREGDYPDIDTTGLPAGPTDGISDVSQLTGRYLNKAPIDPWGKPYVINIFSGTVYSSGPNRTPADDDDISVPYQPPLALVAAKWVDKNQTGSVDDINVPDEVHLYFSRVLDVTGVEPDATVVTGTEADAVDTREPVSAVGGLIPLLSLSSIEGGIDFGYQFDVANALILPNRKVIVLPIKGAVEEALNPLTTDTTPFTPGQDTIHIVSAPAPTSFLYDKAANKSLTDQKVVILPQ
ncbi:MAG: hypothetical protein A2W80_13335 [Candidatus Riflebacteria bacterium GWC2_50_8]|nr:MAG: hypothetical protein A2W80_13335 [Candidatus Riflebacteria bacterium GWC2_50_8]